MADPYAEFVKSHRTKSSTPTEMLERMRVALVAEFAGEYRWHRGYTDRFERDWVCVDCGGDRDAYGGCPWGKKHKGGRVLRREYQTAQQQGKSGGEDATHMRANDEQQDGRAAH